MSFMYPLGLLGLIGIPIVIIIYILRSKYNEQTVTSTYLWKLSDKFLKRKNPLSGLTGLISLFLQILTIACISFAVAKPIIVLPNAAYDYCFVLDASGSMNMKNGKQSRFELAQEEIADIIRDAADGSSFTLVSVAKNASTVFEQVTNKDLAIEAVKNLSAGYQTHAYTDVLSAAQRRFDDNTSAIIYLVTDKTYTAHENIDILDVSGENEENYAIFDVNYSQSGGKLKVDANVIAYQSNAELTVELFVDDAKDAAASTTVSVKAGELTPVSLECANFKFTHFKTRIAQADGYIADNSITTHNLKTDKTYSTLIVSETGFFLESVLDALLDSDVTLIDPDEYDQVTETYGLYIFDCWTPSVLPDSSVWLINADKSIEDAGFGVRGPVELGDVDVMKKSTSSSTAVRELLKGVDGKALYINSYIKYSGMYLDFVTLFSYDSHPLIFAGANGLGNRQVVFGFDLHKSDIAMTPDFVRLCRNLLEYSFPDVINRTNYIVGEEVVVNVLPNAESIKAYSPSGKEVYMESDGIYATLDLSEIGTYTIDMKIAGVETAYKIYSGAHPDESQPNVTEDAFSLSGERGYEKRDGTYDPLMILFICVILLFVADWGGYCYEKYQLR